jgi:protein-disulfide isomerase
MRRRSRGVVAVVAGVAALCALVAPVGASPGTTLVGGIPQRGTVLGAKSAQVMLIQFEDLGCAHCDEYMENAFPAVVQNYVRTGLVKVDFRGLGVVTPASLPALRYTLAASRQKRLWEMAELFYENQGRLATVATDKGVRRLVTGLPGLDVAKLLADAKSVSVRTQIAGHAAEAERRGVEGTPWFLLKIGDAAPVRVQPDAYDGDAFAAILDKALGR